uniref:Integrase catalytic domain-containing protein n=1 Tax=Ananas comosus var. bracteatus TaxID=296719 RepID=A0A6V7NYC7_ANACO|nr:unnamed protein product [Ananas comosus var. bracteatus]
MKVSKGALVVMKGIRVGNLYKLLGSTMTDETYAATKNDDLPLRIWHKRLGHMSEKGMKILVEKKLILDIIFGDSKFCEHCVYGKHHKRSFKAGSHTSKGILDYIHTDVWSSPTTSYGGANYYISFIDYFSQKVWVKFLKLKGEAFQAFKHFKAKIENLTGCHIKVLRSDNGLEYKSKEFELFCKENDISRHYTNPYDPQQNGVAERMNHTLMERARSMLSNAGLEHELWAEAVSIACYLVSRSPSMAINGKTPEEGVEHESIEKEEVRNDTQNFELPSSTFSPNEDIESEDTPIEYGEIDDQIHENFNDGESSREGGETHDLPRHSTRERHAPMHLKDFVDPNTF